MPKKLKRPHICSYTIAFNLFFDDYTTHKDVMNFYISNASVQKKSGYLQTSKSNEKLDEYWASVWVFLTKSIAIDEATILEIRSLSEGVFWATDVNRKWGLFPLKMPWR